MKKKFIYIQIVILFILLNTSIYSQTCYNNFRGKRYKFVLEKVIDGDTYKGYINGKLYKVRLLGIDTPEIPHGNDKISKNKPNKFYGISKDILDIYGKKATLYVKNIIHKRDILTLMCLNKRDKYKRLLCYVKKNDLIINEILLKKGLARSYPFSKHPCYDRYRLLEIRAICNKKGLWKNLSLSP